ncbi:WD40-repeat-containing domain protein [Trametes punicea]|nr:WD40-repeat-containing domain protein [Trametes punicea]
MWFSLSSSTRGQYRVIGTLRGHTKSVFSLDFSSDGKYLASGVGGDGVKLWDLRTNTSLRTPPYRAAFGPVSQVLWIPSRSGMPTVCSGTGLGYLCLWAQSEETGVFTEVFNKRMGGGAEILALAYEVLTPTDTRIAVADRSCFVGVYSFDGRAELLPIFTARLNQSIPISISFANTKGREVYVFGLHDGTMYKLSGTNGKVLASKNLGDKIGHASLQAKQQLIVVDNVSSGFDVWNLNGETHQRTFPTGKPTRFVPRQVNFADDAKTIVGGSDHGAVYVFDRKTGAPLDVLRHAQQGLVQTVATTDRDGFSIIASGTSCGTGLILLWQAKKAPAAARRRRTTLTLGTVLGACLRFLMLAAACAFLWQNFGDLVSAHIIMDKVRLTDYPP